MRASLIPTAVVITLAALANAQSKQDLTNDVPITETGIRLIITGGDLRSADPTAAPEQLKVEAPISYVLHSVSPNAYGLLWLRSSNSFVVNLTTPNGIPVPKTARGRSMGAGPKLRTNPFDTGATPNRLPLGRVDVRDFPRLTDLFNFPSNGVYVLEVQCWAWSQTKKRFVLSSPVRVRVVKGSATNQPTMSR